MGDEPYTTQQKTSTKTFSGAPRSSTSPHQAAYAAERARMLFGSYRRGDANDPTLYVAATKVSDIHAEQRTGTFWRVETDAGGPLPLLPGRL